MADGRASASAYRHPLTMGLRPEPLASWLAPHADDAPQLRRRTELLAVNEADVVACLPQSDDAVAEFIAQLATLQRASIAPGPTKTRLRHLGQSLVEDLCVLTPDGDAHILSAAIVCFPNRWRLADKIGKPVAAIHGPVPEYAEKLARAVDRFLAELAPLQPMARANWGLTDTAELHLPLPGSPVDLADPARVFLRTERQSFTKLPRTAAVIFAIRTELTPWRALAEAERAALSDAVGRLSPDWRRYKSLTGR